jgi:hypothetical protein
MAMVIGNIQATVKFRYYFAPILGFVRQILSVKIRTVNIK